MSSENPEDTPSLEELANLPRVEFSAEVEERCDRFTEFYNQHRFVIENRWIKMTKRSRIQLLTKHWRSSGGTGMPQEHAPDLTELAPWRDPKPEGKNRPTWPPRGVDHSHLRWPLFNQTDLSDLPHPFLQLLFSRSSDHPKEFAAVDCFFENRTSAMASIRIGLKDPDFHTLVVIPNGGLRIKSGGLNSDQGDSIYGAIEIVDNPDDAQQLVESRLWLEEDGKHLMIIQRRIYHFLEDVVRDIMAEDNDAKYKVDEEDTQTIWEPQLPKPEAPDDEFDRKQAEYIRIYRTIVPYKSAGAEMWDYATQIISRRIEIYENRLRGLKTDPGDFMKYLNDIRQHSHHEVSYDDNRIHPFANLDDNQNNGSMWATYLLRALHHATGGLDFWRCVLAALERYREMKRDAAEGDNTDEDDSREVETRAWLIIFYVTLYNLVRPLDLRDTLACSQSIRKYFKNSSHDDEKPVLSSGGQGYPALPKNNAKVASLVSLLRAMSEQYMDILLPLKSETLASEILTILQGQRGGTWMTNFGLEKAEENHDAASVWLLLRRFWKYHDLDENHPLKLIDKLPEDSPERWDVQLVATKKLLGLNLNDIVAKHMIPYPAARFEYPNIGATVKPKKRKELAGKRRDAEARLKALWADLQPLLSKNQAISQGVTEFLIKAIPTATGEDGEDETPQEPPTPPAPSTPPQGPPGPEGAGSPHTPPGQTDPHPGQTDPATGTPTQQLGGLGINSPAIRPPPLRTPERKTANDGVKKISPIRPARPGEDGPRRPQIDREARRDARRRAIEARSQARTRPPIKAVIAPEAPTAAPPAAEYPKIPLSAQSYDIIRRVYVTSRERNPGGIPWQHIRTLFDEIGFLHSGRGARGGLNVFTPSEELTRTQGINTIISRDRPHNPRLGFIKTREFLRGIHGFGKYGWDFDKFTER